MKTKILLAAVVLLAGALSYSFIAPSEPAVYEYMTVTQYGQNKVAVSGTSISFNEEKVGMHSVADFTPCLKRVQELGSQGWELVENRSEGVTINYFLLRKKKE